MGLWLRRVDGMGIISVIGVISNGRHKKVVRPKSDNLICESVDKMWDFKACEPEKSQKK